MSNYRIIYSDELCHYGVLGMKWGVRRYQNPDGSYTAAGRKRYGIEGERVNTAKDEYKIAKKEYSKAYNKSYNYSARHPISQYTNKEKRRESDRLWEDTYNKASKVDKARSEYKTVKKEYSSTDEARRQRAIKIGTVAAVTALAVVGTYALYKSGKLDDVILKGRNKTASMLGLDPQNGLKLSKNKTLPDNWFDDSFLHNKSLEINRWDESNPGSMMNCGNCAIAFEAKMRGYRVCAKDNNNGMAASSIGQLFKGLKEESFAKVDIDNSKLKSLESCIDDDFNIIPGALRDRGKQVETAIKNTITTSYRSSEEARGMLFVPMTTGSHWVSWVKKGNEVKFINSQNNKVDLIEDCFSLYTEYRNNDAASLKTIRLDDLEFNNDNIRTVIQSGSRKVVDKLIQRTYSNDMFKTFELKGENFVTDLLSQR